MRAKKAESIQTRAREPSIQRMELNSGSNLHFWVFLRLPEPIHKGD